MDKTLRKVRKLLHEEFPSAQLDLKRNWHNSLIGGFVVWRGFAGKDDADRSRRAWDVIRNGLTDKERSEIAALFTLTPLEQRVMREELELSERMG